MLLTRDPHEAELRVSNAIAEINEALVVLRQFKDVACTNDAQSAMWYVQIQRLERAVDSCSAVRFALTKHPDFAVLRPK